MVRRRVMTWAVALALGGGLGTAARAGAVTFTGNVAADMPTTPGINNGVYAVPGVQPGQVAQAGWITQAGWVNGFAIKDMRFDYNSQTDTMQVGVNFYSIAGDSSGDPMGSPNPKVAAVGGQDQPGLGGRKSISVEFASAAGTAGGQVGTPVIVAGVPENKSSAGTGIDGFTVAAAGSNSSIQANYGAAIPGANGNLAFDPSPAHPGFEFAIKNWSKFTTLAGPNGFYVSAYAGSPDDVVAGETKLSWVHIPAPALTPAPQVVPDPTPAPVPTHHPNVPEPAALACWGVLAGAAGLALRRARRTTDRG